MSLVNRGNALVAVTALVAGALAVLALQPVDPPAGAAGFTPPTTRPVPMLSAGRSPLPAQAGGAPQAYIRFTPSTAQARLLFLGGRITKDFFVSSRDLSYSALVADGVREDFDVQDVQRRTAEATSADGAETLDASAADEDLIVLEVGTSEVAPLRPFITQYATMVQQIRAARADSAIVCLGLWGGAGNPYDIEIARTCRRNGGIFVELSDLYERNAFRGPIGTLTPAGTRDNFHPNDGGHAAIANRILDALKGNPVVPVPSATPR